MSEREGFLFEFLLAVPASRPQEPDPAQFSQGVTFADLLKEGACSSCARLG